MITNITPGPWAVLPDDLEKVHAQGVGVAVMSGAGRSREERRANAQAIAALPELIKALSAALHYLDGIVEEAPDPRAEMEAALEKAGAL